MDALLRPGVTFDPDEAWANVRANIVDRLMTDEDRATSPTSRSGGV